MHFSLALPALLALSLSLPLTSQNFVTNGDFAAGLSGWTENGYNCNSGIQTYDVAGTGASQSYHCMPGGQVVPPPYPPNTLEQSVLMVPGIDYEFSCDVTAYRTVLVGNADGGTVYAEVNGVEITRIAFGGISPPEIKRARLCVRFQVATAGLLQLKLNFHRNYLCALGTTPTPVVAVDNISLQFAAGATFNITGNLKLKGVVAMEAKGVPSAPFAVFASPTVLSQGAQIPGITGVLFLDPRSTALVYSGALDASGSWSVSITVPADPYLTLAPSYFQAAHVRSRVPEIGFHSAFVFVP